MVVRCVYAGWVGSRGEAVVARTCQMEVAGSVKVVNRQWGVVGSRGEVWWCSEDSSRGGTAMLVV